MPGPDFLPDTPVHASFAPDHDLVMLEGDTLALSQTLPRGAFSLIITSPPYNIGKVYEDPKALDLYLDDQARTIDELLPLLRPTGSLCWQVGNFVEGGEVFPLDIYFYPVFKRLGMKLRNRIVWHFDHGLHASHRFSGRYETLCWFTRSDDYTFHLDAVRVPSKYPGKRHYKGGNRGKPSGNPLGKNPSDFWRFLADEWDSCVWEIPNVKSNHPEKTNHPCQFPVELVERCILALTDEGDWVLDPYAGVGSTLLACLKNRRRGVGIERDAGYCALARRRIVDFQQGRLKTRPLGKPVHQPSGREKVARLPIEWTRDEEKAD